MASTFTFGEIRNPNTTSQRHPTAPIILQRWIHLSRGGVPAASSGRSPPLFVGAPRRPQPPPPVAPRPPTATLGRFFLPEADMTGSRDRHTAFLAALRGTSPSLAQLHVRVLVHEEGGIPARGVALGAGNTSIRGGLDRYRRIQQQKMKHVEGKRADGPPRRSAAPLHRITSHKKEPQHQLHVL